MGFLTGCDVLLELKQLKANGYWKYCKMATNEQAERFCGKYKGLSMMICFRTQDHRVDTRSVLRLHSLWSSEDEG